MPKKCGVCGGFLGTGDSDFNALAARMCDCGRGWLGAEEGAPAVMDDSNTLAVARLAEVMPLLESAGWETITHVDVWGIKDGVQHKMTVMLRPKERTP